MAKKVERSVFRDSALLSGLVSQAQLDAAVAEISRQGDSLPTPLENVGDEELAAKLVAANVLTPYQAVQLKAGRTKLTLGPYAITDWIGQGGMGQVFKAVHKVLGRECAIKVLPRHKSTPEAIDSFQREIRTQAQLDHQNLVRAYDAGHDGNVHYLVTEYVPGTDLRQLVRRQGPLTMQQSAKVILQAARGLDHAHRRGLIHRDVKPGNILVTPDGVAKVSDLGLSAFMEDADKDPRAGKIVGTADYLSPEQIRNPLQVTLLSDIYSLGCTLYYAVSGKVPFPGGTTRDKARRHCEETPWHPRRFNPEVSEEFVEIIADMMEKKPEERIPTMADVAARLEPWAQEAEALPSQQLTKSPWMPPPVPIDTDDDQDTHPSDIYENGDRGSGSGSGSGSGHLSQQTGALAGGGQDTLRMRRVRPPSLKQHLERLHRTRRLVFLALVVAVPVSLAIGALATFVLLHFFE